MKFCSPPVQTSLWSVTPVCLFTCLSMTSGVAGTCLSLQVCSGWSQVIWQLPQVSEVDGVLVDEQGSSSTLQLWNVTWKNSGRYTCEEPSSDQSRNIDVFIPGQGNDPHDVWLCCSCISLVQFYIAAHHCLQCYCSHFFIRKNICCLTV